MRPAPARVRGTIRKTRRRFCESSGALTAVLADGMGGHTGGALASGLACKFFLHAYATSSGDVPARLAEALDLANAAIAHETAENPALSGMGCTLIGAAFGPDGIEWVSVGDSPLFLVRKGEIVLLNEDHSLAPEIDKLAAAGKITLGCRACRSAPPLPALGPDGHGDRPDRPIAPAAGAAAWRRGDPGQRRHPHHLPRRHRKSGRLCREA